MKRKRRISRLKRENRRLRKENKKLHDKHWSECRQISAYDEENRKLRLALLIISSSVSAGRTGKPKKTYKEDFLEKFPNARRYYYGDPASCRKNIYGHGIPNCPGYDGKDGRYCVGCWNEMMPDE